MAFVSNLAVLLPMAFVMCAGPQIISAVLLATSEDARKNSLVFLLGVGTAVAGVTTVLYLLAGALHSSTSSSSDSGATTLDYGIVVLLVYLAFRVYQHRVNTEPPAWMTKLQTATPQFSFRIGLMLFALMPTDVITMIAVASTLASNDDPLLYAAPFLATTLLFASTPLLMLLLLGRRADEVLPKMRTWMTANSWIVSEVVIVFFLAMTLNGMRG
jgi:hypothetical protein